MEAAPDLIRFLSPDELSFIEHLSVPVVHTSEGSLPLTQLLDWRAAFAAIVVDGVVLHRLAIGGEPGLRILAPGDVVFPVPDGGGPTFGRSMYSARSSARLALLGGDFLNAVRHAPRLLVGLQSVTAEQLDRLSTQLVICQLPRVSDRVLAMLWLLADSFGRVTTAGTRLPLSLTHEVLGALVGARRPTVTLAIGELTKRGAVIHQDRGWLLLERPPTEGVDERRTLDEPQLVDQIRPESSDSPVTGWATADGLAALSDSVGQLLEEHRQTMEGIREQLRRAAASRAHSSELRRRLGERRGIRG